MDNWCSFESLGELKSKLPTLWSRSYFVSTHGHVSTDIVEKYRGAAADYKMKMIKSYKFRIYPNKQRQIQTLTQTIETCWLLYNDSLEQWRKDKGLLSYHIAPQAYPTKHHCVLNESNLSKGIVGLVTVKLRDC
jgi:hypothetical protein